MHGNFNFEAHNLVQFACNLDIGRHIWLGNPYGPNLVPMNLDAVIKLGESSQKKIKING